ncbi:hypothetical protein MYMAC_005590 [Corallococcus macrosporus DSM 14697]|uniref:Uncharacterized protein n=1 Tax=Corallococcus macrosporus DSM 14697 TaxID=1189310 RepID=A0A250K3K1_9BACT|nr:hypothetical protein MYMAC_005590 [Corallococcus macrosporus DSM 14697]
MSFTSRLEGLLQNVGLGGIVGEVRARLGLKESRDTSAPRTADFPAPAPRGAPQQTVVERTPRPRPSIPQPSEAVSAPEPTVAERTPARGAVTTDADAPSTAQPSAPEPSRKAAAKAPRSGVKKKKPAAKKAQASTGAKAEKKTAHPAAKPKKRVRAAKEAAAPATGNGSTAVDQLLTALRSHPRQQEFISAGKQKDQLVRSLIPLYLARSLDADFEVTSGTTSRFWGELGVTYAAPNAAKALRLHGGYAQDTKKGKAITSRGVQYVEEMLSRFGDASSGA